MDRLAKHDFFLPELLGILVATLLAFVSACHSKQAVENPQAGSSELFCFPARVGSTEAMFCASDLSICQKAKDKADEFDLGDTGDCRHARIEVTPL